MNPVDYTMSSPRSTMPDDGKGRNHLKARRVVVSDSYAVWKAKHKEGTSKTAKQTDARNEKKESCRNALLVEELSLTMDQLWDSNCSEDHASMADLSHDRHLTHSEGHTSTSSLSNSISSSMSAEQLASRSLRKQQARARKIMNQKLAERLHKSTQAHIHLVQNQNDDDDEDMFTMFSWSGRRLSLVSPHMDQAAALESEGVLDLESPPVVTLYDTRNLPWFRRGSLAETVQHRNTSHRRRSWIVPKVIDSQQQAHQAPTSMIPTHVVAPRRGSLLSRMFRRNSSGSVH